MTAYQPSVVALGLVPIHFSSRADLFLILITILIYLMFSVQVSVQSAASVGAGRGDIIELQFYE